VYGIKYVLIANLFLEVTFSHFIFILYHKLRCRVFYLSIDHI